MSHRFVFILNWKANCENNLKDFPVEDRHVAIALENSPKLAQNVAKKCSNRARSFEKSA